MSRCPKCYGAMMDGIGSDEGMVACLPCGIIARRDTIDAAEGKGPRPKKTRNRQEKLDSSPEPTEAQFQQTILDLATACGWRHFHVHNSFRSDAGWPDLVLAHPERKQILFVELKKNDKAQLTPDQKKWLAVLHVCGLETRLWRPSAWESIERTLKGAEL